MGLLTNGDNILFVWKTNAGNEFKATLRIDSPVPKGRYGIMIRKSQESDSQFVFLGISSQKIFAYRRDAKGEFSSTEADIPEFYKGKPVILKFYPNDEQLVPAYSFDSAGWSSFTDYAISNSVQTFIGFTLSSGSPSDRVAAHFVDVSIRK
jgi:hypothetical protein